MPRARSQILQLASESRTDLKSPSVELLDAGRAALARGAWEEARDCLERSLRLDESSEALEQLGLAAWWLNDATTPFDARESAYRLYKERGDMRGAARVASWVGVDYAEFRGEQAIATGWLQRARRALEGIELFRVDRFTFRN
jgi:hypothetical protein